MEIEIVEIEELSGRKGHVYSIMAGGEGYTLLDKFFEENAECRDELEDILERISAMKDLTGFRREFFTHNEGSPGEGIAVLKSGEMRLYCIYFDRTAIIFGDGGMKKARAWEDDPLLSEKVGLLKRISIRINMAIREKDMRIREDGTIEFCNGRTFEL